MTRAAVTSTKDLDAIALRMEVSRFRREWAAARLDLYRRYLQVTVNRATPLLALAAADQSIDVKGAMMRIQPPVGWPDSTARGKFARSFAHVLRHYTVFANVRDANPSRSVTVRGVNHIDGLLIIRIAGSSVELTMSIGDVTVRTDGGTVSLGLAFELPHAIEGAIMGKPVSTLVSHRWFGDATWVISEVTRAGGCTTVVFKTGYAEYRMPWRPRVAA